MATTFTLISFISLIGLIIGLIRPAIFSKFTKTPPKRKTILFIGLGVLLLSFIGIGLFAPKVPNNKTTGQKDIILNQTNTEQLANISENQNENDNSTNQQEELNQPAAQNNTEYYPVFSVVDGDTFKVSINGTTETVRLIGINTPESVDPRKPVECFGIEASNRAKQLLSGNNVKLEADSTQSDRDIYNRLLRYAWLEEGMFYNKQMILDGYAYEYTYNTPYKYQAEFKQAQTEAQNAKLGLWADGACAQNNTNTQPANPAPAPNQSNGQTFYTSSYYSAKYYYCDTDAGWQNLSPTYLKSFASEAELLQAYPNRILHEPCQ